MKVRTASESISLKAKLTDYAQLAKLRLASLVVFSALTGYFFAIDMHEVSLVAVLSLIFGGFLVTGSSNALTK